MFELLNWENSSLTQHDFKKNRDYRQISEAYLQQIEKSKWSSEAKENYVTPDGNIPVNENTLYKVENYIHNKESKSVRIQREK